MDSTGDTEIRQFSAIRQTVARFRLNNGWPDYEACKFCDGMAGYRLSDGNKALYQCLQCDTPFAMKRYPGGQR